MNIKKITIGWIPLSLLCLIMPGETFSQGSITISWQPNNENDLCGYRIYYGLSSGQYQQTIEAGNVCEYTIKELEPQKKYFLALTAYDFSGNESDFSVEVSAYPDTIETTDASNVPHYIILYQNYPNPFNPLTTISYELSEESHVIVRIINTKGQTVKVLVDAEMPAGFYRVDWNSSDEFDKQVASGIYFARLETKFYQLTRPMVFSR